MPPPNASDAPTQLGNYDLLYKIAEGGMGAVYKGRHRFTGDIVAVKVIAANTAKNPVLLQRFEREFQTAKMLEHPNVVRGIEYQGAGPQPFLVMEFVDGESLGQRVERDGPVPEAEAVRLIAQVCDGLQKAHKQGLVHRDVKPDNILLNREGQAKLTDLGLVKELDDNLNLTKTGRGLGTPHFMAPEQFRNAKGVDVRCDIYSVGATLYTMVTGQVPFGTAGPLDCWMKKIRNEFPAPKAVAPHLSDRIDWAIRRAMSADPAQRPASCREFVEDLTGEGRKSGVAAHAAQAANPTDLWYMVYKDEAGQPHTVKGQADGIRRALQDNLLGDASNILVSRSKGGQFVPLASVPEFRDLVVNPAPVAKPPGLLGRSGAMKRPSDEAVDFAANPPPGSGPSGAMQASKGGRPVVVPTPFTAGGADANAETAPYARHTPSGAGGTSRRHTPIPATPAEPFDWTPVLAGLVAVLTVTVAYLLFFK